MLEQYAVSSHKAGYCVADYLISREIPGLNAVDNSDGAVGYQAVAAVGQFPLFILQQFRSRLGSVFANAGAKFNFLTPLPVELAHFPGHGFHQFVLMVAQGLSQILKVLAAFGVRKGFPFQKSSMTGPDGLINLLIGKLLIRLDSFASGGISGC